MLSEKFQRKVFAAYKNSKTFPQGNYEYSIQYNPVSDPHTWIVRKRALIREEWSWLQPLNESIR